MGSCHNYMFLLIHSSMMCRWLRLIGRISLSTRWIWTGSLMALTNSIRWFNTEAVLGVAVNLAWQLLLSDLEANEEVWLCQEITMLWAAQVWRGGLGEWDATWRERPRRHKVCEWRSRLGCLAQWRLHLTPVPAAVESSHVRDTNINPSWFQPTHRTMKNNTLFFKPLHFGIVFYEAIDNQNRICYQRQTLKLVDSHFVWQVLEDITLWS